MDDAENDDDVKLLFAIDEAANLLQETGYRKSICQLKMSDKDGLRSTLVDCQFITVRLK